MLLSMFTCDLTLVHLLYYAAFNVYMWPNTGTPSILCCFQCLHVTSHWYTFYIMLLSMFTCDLALVHLLYYVAFNVHTWPHTGTPSILCCFQCLHVTSHWYTFYIMLLSMFTCDLTLVHLLYYVAFNVYMWPNTGTPSILCCFQCLHVTSHR